VSREFVIDLAGLPIREDLQRLIAHEKEEFEAVFGRRIVFRRASDTERAWVIDPEFAYYGPMGFDIGAVLGNLVIAYAAQLGHTPDEQQRAAYQAYLLQTLAEVWQQFVARFDALWRAGDPAAPEAFRQSFLLALLRDSIGFAACKMIRRVLGVAHVIDLEQIADPAQRARAETWVLDIAERMLLERASIVDTAALLAAIRSCPMPA
jgi:5-methylthioribose kinase